MRLLTENEAVQRLEVKVRDYLELDLDWEKNEEHHRQFLVGRNLDIHCATS